MATLSSDTPIGPMTPVASLVDVDISQELLSRPTSTPNRKEETAAMYSLASAVWRGSTSTLKKLSNLAIELCNAGSAGVSVIESTDAGTVFRWKALAGDVEQYEGGSTPGDWSPCGECLKAGHAVLYSYPARYFTYFEMLDRPIVEGLVIPVLAGSLPVATIWVVSHKPECRFDAEHVRIMTSLGSFAASVLEFKENLGAGAGGENDPNSHCNRFKRSEAPKAAGDVKAQRELVWREYVRRVTRRDELALEALLEETRALVFTTALRIVSFQVDAEEVAADVYARVWATAGTYDTRRGSVGSWLVNMARSRSLDRLRARAVRNRTEAALISLCNKCKDPEALIDASETRDRLQRALHGLPSDQRCAIELFYFSDLSGTEIAATLGLPIGTVKTRLRLATMKLRRLLAALESASPRLKPTSSFFQEQPSRAARRKNPVHESAAVLSLGTIHPG